MGWKTPPECLNTFAFTACSQKAGATLPWPSRRDEVRCYAFDRTQRRLAHEVWSNQLSVQGYSAPFRDLLIRQNYVCRFESSSNPHQFVIETVDRHLVCRQRVPMCAVVIVRLYSPQSDPTIPRAYLGSGPWNNLGSSGAFA